MAKTNEDRVIDTCENLIARIKTHEETVRQIQADERKLNESWVNGFNRGILEGLEAAINIIKQAQNDEYNKITAAYVEKAKRELAKNEARGKK